MAAVEQQTTEAFEQIETTEPNAIRFKCPCGQVIKKREDSFLPGAHMMICTVCGNTSSEMTMLDGSKQGVRSKDSAGRVG